MPSFLINVIKERAICSKDRQNVPEIPKSHRFVSRPGLDEIFSEKMMQDKIKRDKRIIEAVQKYGYTQQQIAAQVNLHYSTISNLVRGKT